MKLIWTKSRMPLSKMIRWAFSIECSHFAIVFESPGGGLMFESNLFGTHPTFYRNSLKNHELVHSIDIPLSVKKEDAVWDIVVNLLDGKTYDFRAFVYEAWRALLFKLFKIPIPEKNVFEKPDSYLCVEIYDAIMHEIGLPISIDTGMINPHQLYDLIFEKIKEAGVPQV